MNLYLMWQDIQTGFDTFDSAVVVAESEEEARKIHPFKFRPDYAYPIIVKNQKFIEIEKDNYSYHESLLDSWCENIKDVQVKYIGIASPELEAGSVICASFNAG